MNEKLRKYKQNRLRGMSRYNAARAAGYSESKARYGTGSLEKKEDQSLNLRNTFEQAGFTDKAIVDFTLRGMEAVKFSFDKFGNAYPAEDWSMRHRFFETALRLTGKLKEDARSGGGNPLNRLVVVYPQGFAPGQSPSQSSSQATSRQALTPKDQNIIEVDLPTT